MSSSESMTDITEAHITEAHRPQMAIYEEIRMTGISRHHTEARNQTTISESLLPGLTFSDSPDASLVAERRPLGERPHDPAYEELRDEDAKYDPMDPRKLDVMPSRGLVRKS